MSNGVIEGKSHVLGDNIRRKRIEQSISQEELAERLDISRQSISKWETGLSEPSTKNLAQLSVIFHCALSELIGETVQVEEEFFCVIGIAVTYSDVPKLKTFFQELPSDVLDCGEGSVVLTCGSKGSERKSLENLIKMQTGRACETVVAGVPLRPGTIYLSDTETHRGTFDEFFEIMAHTYGERAVAVLFSEQQRDGRAGIRLVKEAGGFCILCEPDHGHERERQRDASGGSGFNYVLEPMNMGYWIANHVRKKYFENSNHFQGFFTERLFHRMQECLKKTGIQYYADIKEEVLIKALLKRIRKSEVASVDYYVRLLEDSRREQKLLTECILDYIWRKEEDWRWLLGLTHIIEAIKPEFNGIRIWVAGCGMDAYVVAMLLADYMEEHSWYEKIKIFATGVDEDMVGRAVAGYLKTEVVEQLPEQWRRKYFRKNNNEYQVSQRIRNMLIFSVHDILTNPPFARLDILICRNAIKKFRARSRKAMIARFSYALKKGGYLVLGQGEDSEDLCRWFECEENFKGRIWRKERSAPISLNLNVMEGEKEPLALSKIVEELLTASTPACIILDERYEILYTGKEAGKYLQFRSGEFSQNFFDNVDKKTSVLIDMGIKYLDPLGKRQEVMVVKEGRDGEKNVDVHMLCRMIRERVYYLIWFEEEDEERKEKDSELFSSREEKLEKELDVSQKNLYQVIKELDNTRDKYELINEKLQSANEELTLMNDELQMVNQELAASNRKLTRVNREYQKTINDMPAFFNEGIDFYKLMGLQVIFLDEEFCIKKMSEGIPEMTHIREYDVGQDMTGINLMTGYLGWREDVKAAKKGNKVLKVVDGQKDKRYIVQILPYNLEETGPLGYVILIQTIEKKRRAEE